MVEEGRSPVSKPRPTDSVLRVAGGDGEAFEGGYGGRWVAVASRVSGWRTRWLRKDEVLSRNHHPTSGEIFRSCPEPCETRGSGPLTVGGRCLSRPMAATTITRTEQVLAVARATRSAITELEVEQLVQAVEWAALHPGDGSTRRCRGPSGTSRSPVTVHPRWPSSRSPSSRSRSGSRTDAGTTYVGDAVELAHRLPRLWQRVLAGEVPVWKARRVAAQTKSLSMDAAGYVDSHLAPTCAPVLVRADRTHRRRRPQAVRPGRGRSPPGRSRRAAALRHRPAPGLLRRPRPRRGRARPGRRDDPERDDHRPRRHPRPRAPARRAPVDGRRDARQHRPGPATRGRDLHPHPTRTPRWSASRTPAPASPPSS